MFSLPLPRCTLTRLESFIYNLISSLTGSLPCCSTEYQMPFSNILRTGHLGMKGCNSVSRKVRNSILNGVAVPSSAHSQTWWSGCRRGDMWNSSFKKDQDSLQKTVLTWWMPAFVGEWNKWRFGLELPDSIKALLVKCMISEAIQANLQESLK